VREDPALPSLVLSFHKWTASLRRGAAKDRQLLWFDRNGKQTGAVPGEDAYSGVSLSPHGKKLAYYLDGTGFDVWSLDIAVV